MKHKNSKILTLPLRIALVVLIFGALFKVMHWSYAKELMFTSGITIGVLYSIRFFNKTEKSQLDYVKLSLILIWVFSYLVQVFHLFSVPYILEACLLILLLWWFVKEGVSYFKNRKFKKKNFIKAVYYVLIGLATFTLFLGIIFKIQHWPYGSELFVLGVLLLNTILILDYFLFERNI